MYRAMYMMSCFPICVLHIPVYQPLIELISLVRTTTIARCENLYL